MYKDRFCNIYFILVTIMFIYLHVLYNRYVLCGNGNETITHLFIHCNTVIHIWSMILSSCRLNFRVFLSIEHYLRWDASGEGTHIYIPMFTFWDIWKPRNHYIFRGVPISVYRICAKILSWLEHMVPRW